MINTSFITNRIPDVEFDLDSETGTDIGDVGPAEQARAMQARAVGPSSVAYEYGTARAGEDWIKCLFVASMPSKISPGIINELNTHPNTSVEPVIHFDPADSASKIQDLKSGLNDLKIRLQRQLERSDPDADQTKFKMAEHRHMRNVLQSGSQQLFDIGVYIRIRGPSKDAVDSEASSIRTELDKKDVDIRTVDYQSDAALTTTSPAGKNELDGVTGQMFGDAIGAMFPFSASTLYEDDGILFGYHAITQEPFQFDRFNREGGYNVLTVGDLGSGKTFSTQLLLLRRMAMDPDTVLVMIDPVNSFTPLAREVGAERIQLGGQRGLNPLEIRPTPQHVIDAQDIPPFAQWFSTSMGWLGSYFNFIGSSSGAAGSGNSDDDSGSSGSGLSRKEYVVLSTAVRQTAYGNGITSDPSTHDNPSPTPLQLRQTLADIADDTVAFFEESTTATDKGAGTNIAPDEQSRPGAGPADESVRNPDEWERIAGELHMAMSPFVRGGFTNMAGSSDVDMTGKATYIDLQRGGSPREQALRLQAPFNVVYQRAVESPKRMIIAIDEIHLLFNTPNSLEWLDTVARDSRHADISLHMITQQASDFFAHPMAESLAGLTSHKIIHKEPDLYHEPYGKKLRLTANEAEFGRSMNPGTPDRGYAHALVDVDDHGTYPIMVQPLAKELMKLDPDMDGPATTASATNGADSNE